jgi:hypothetical protein
MYIKKTPVYKTLKGCHRMGGRRNSLKVSAPLV